jgi:hypothetical protein
MVKCTQSHFVHLFGYRRKVIHLRSFHSGHLLIAYHEGLYSGVGWWTSELWLGTIELTVWWEQLSVPLRELSSVYRSVLPSNTLQFRVKIDLLHPSIVLCNISPVVRHIFSLFGRWLLPKDQRIVHMNLSYFFRHVLGEWLQFFAHVWFESTVCAISLDHLI